MSASAKPRLAGRQPSRPRRGAPGEDLVRHEVWRASAGSVAAPGVRRPLRRHAVSTLTIFDRPRAASVQRPQAPARPIPAVLGAERRGPVKGGTLTRYGSRDSPATAPCLEPVSAAGAAPLPAYSSVPRGAGNAPRLTTARYERARRVVAAFVGARPDDAV